MQLTITDLFVVGLGVDLVGAWLVARGLLLSPSMLKSFGTWAGVGPADVVDRARNRIDARFGISFLMAGFAVQLLGYLLEIDNHRPEQGPDLLPGALALLLGSMLAALLGWSYSRKRLFKRSLVTIAMAPLHTGSVEIAQDRSENVKWLASYGKAAGWHAEMYESDETYVERIFGVRP
jgi:hypothetical protein